MKDKKYGDSGVTINKGEILNRIGSGNEKNVGRTYVSKTERDKYKYIESNKDGFIQTEGDPYLITFKAVKDLKVAEARAQVESFLKVLEDYPLQDIVYPRNIIDDTGKYRLSRKNESRKEADYYAKKFYKDIFEKGDITLARMRFDQLMKNDREVTRAYMNDLARKGYQALIDFNDTPGSSLPIIIIDRADSLRTVSSRKLTEDDYQEAIKRLYKKED